LSPAIQIKYCFAHRYPNLGWCPLPYCVFIYFIALRLAAMSLSVSNRRLDVCAVAFGKWTRQYSAIKKLQLFVPFFATTLRRTTFICGYWTMLLANLSSPFSQQLNALGFSTTLLNS